MVGSHNASQTSYVFLYKELRRDPVWRFVDILFLAEINYYKHEHWQ